MLKRFRFSILGLFATVTIAALSVSLYQTHTRLKSSEEEVRRLRSETGRLTIKDEKKVHLIAVPGTALTWRWRVYLPGGHDFGIYAYKGKLDSNGYPAEQNVTVRSRIGGQSDPRKPREILIDVVLDKRPEGGHCLWIRENGQGYSSVDFGESLPSWMGPDAMFWEEIAGEGADVSADVAVPLGLIRLDARRPGDQTCDDAVLIWIDLFQRGKRSSEMLQAVFDDGVLP